MRTRALVTLALTAALASASLAIRSAAPLAVGEKMRDFTLSRLDGKRIHLAELTNEGPVVVVMLRGWVGYQCPLCTKQVSDFLRYAAEFQAAKANVVLIYPGAADTVQGKAEEFVTGKTIPDKYHFVVDPDLKTVDLYDLRWNAPNETAYPSTFVFDRQGVTRFVKISKSHGDRSAGTEVLAVLRTLK